jgi:hypothetical protein
MRGIAKRAGFITRMCSSESWSRSRKFRLEFRGMILGFRVVA